MCVPKAGTKCGTVREKDLIVSKRAWAPTRSRTGCKETRSSTVLYFCPSGPKSTGLSTYTLLSLLCCYVRLILHSSTTWSVLPLPGSALHSFTRALILAVFPHRSNPSRFRSQSKIYLDDGYLVAWFCNTSKETRRKRWTMTGNRPGWRFGMDAVHQKKMA